MKQMWRYVVLAVAVAALTVTASAQTVSFEDPTGDDNGPGTYSYPTDVVYRAGSFDLTGLDLKVKGDKVEIAVGQSSQLEDKCWAMQFGFCVQMLFVFIQTDPATGHTGGLPGLNVQFAPGSGWNKVVIISPQPAARVKNEVEIKVAKELQGDVVIPGRVKGMGRTITAWVDAKELGGGDPMTWGYQVLMQSNEGFPDKADLLTRKVNEYEGQHRFGGGTDTDCDPHVMDLLAGDAVGDKGEVELQHKMLGYECNADGTAKALATLTLVHPGK